MLETEVGSGNYEMTTRDSWPTEGYIFNENLSKCENGSTLSWDNEKNIVVVSGNMSDKCYVYFDAKSPYYLEIGTKLTTTYIDCWVTKECKITYYGNKPQHTLYVMYYFNEITLDVIEEILESYYVVSSVGGISQPTNLEKGYAIHDNYYLVASTEGSTEEYNRRYKIAIKGGYENLCVNNKEVVDCQNENWMN